MTGGKSSAEIEVEIAHHRSDQISQKSAEFRANKAVQVLRPPQPQPRKVVFVCEEDPWAISDIQTAQRLLMICRILVKTPSRLLLPNGSVCACLWMHVDLLLMQPTMMMVEWMVMEMEGEQKRIGANGAVCSF